MTKLIVGCGYLGARVAALWLQRGQPVFATTRRAERAAELHRRGLEPVVCDVLEPESLRQLPAADTVVYCVGLDRASGANMRQVYVEGLANVLQQLPEPAHFIYVSSTSVYGQTGGEFVDENAATLPLDEAGRIVLEAERLLHARLPKAIILRFAGIYGPERLLRQRDLEAGQPLGADPDHWLNLIHVEDGATTILAAEAAAVPGTICNVCDGHAVQRRDFYTLLAQLLHAPAPRFAPAQGSQAPRRRDLANRRVSNQQLVRELRAEIEYPTYRQGLQALVSGQMK